MDSFVLIAYASLATSRTLLQRLLACLNFTLDSEDLFCYPHRLLFIMPCPDYFVMSRLCYAIGYLLCYGHRFLVLFVPSLYQSEKSLMKQINQLGNRQIINGHSP